MYFTLLLSDRRVTSQVRASTPRSTFLIPEQIKEAFFKYHRTAEIRNFQEGTSLFSEGEYFVFTTFRCHSQKAHDETTSCAYWVTAFVRCLNNTNEKL